ncbi:ornithine decarboxylase [Maritimibacter sp. 55A14]|uniref:alanine racemase n=1 Tax=Maritimibacter sp. 55A14 TaxID=2174844 RepID=UPI000D60F8FE|nr:alanine racemase [Maritimibacter sp. 55A14]PWE32066.1 ornithine decarboxylase [Maritimibacter sp. 55A14]
MGLGKSFWASPRAHLRAEAPDHPVLFFSAEVLQATARRFLSGFPGLVTYAVKANPAPLVLENLRAAGIRAFDVASPDEIARVRAVAADAALHYHNPVRSPREIAQAADRGVASWSVDSPAELDKLAARLPADSEISVRLRLPVAGAAYDFGTKFGADPEMAAALLARAAGLGFTPSMTFHPGTQCTDAAAWSAYVAASADVARRAGVTLARLNVGGGFPSHRNGPDAPRLESIFEAIDAATGIAFGAARPALVCEPGRAMVAEAFTLAARVKALRPDGSVFLNDGIYGTLAELPSMGEPGRITALGPDGTPRCGATRPRTVFGPTCDSLDRLPGAPALPEDLAEDDYLLFAGMGAYSLAIATGFNGYGAPALASVRQL